MWDTWPYMHSNNLFSQCNLTAQIELVQPKQFKEKKIELHQYWMKKALVICWRISISYGFGDKLNQNDKTKDEFQYLNFLDFNVIFCKMFIFMGYWWTIKKNEYFISKSGKRVFEGMFKTWNSRTRQMSKNQWDQHIIVSSNLLCQAKYSIHTFNLHFVSPLKLCVRTLFMARCTRYNIMW